MIGDLMAFHHLGLATSDPLKAVAFLEALGYVSADPVRDALQNVNLVFCTHDSSPAVEVIYPTDTPGPIDKILGEQKQSFYHVCYEASDIRKVLSSLKDKGQRAQCVSPPTPAVLFDNQLVSFYFISGFGLVEILESN